MRHILSRIAAALLFAITLGASGLAAAQTTCAIGPGTGSFNTSVTGIVNSYYPGTGVSSAGAPSVRVGAISGAGAATPIAAGDLLLVIQIQDAFISTTNSTAYGGSGGGGGYTSLNNAGRYEYVVATGPVSGGAVPLASNLIYTYTEAAANGTTGQRTYQVIRVPQYSSATVTGTVTAPPWDGSTGGVVAFDVAGQLTWGGQTVDVNGRGFRGAAGQCSTTDGSGAPLNTINDYVDNVGTGTLGTAGTGSVLNGAKGESVAGSPIIIFKPTTPFDNTAGTVVNTGGVDGSTGGFPAGSFARGAPGNGGGGGTDGDAALTNQNNTGGAGGGNYGAGGKGGFGWTPGTPPGWDGGGIGGVALPVAFDRLFFGGGGGAGATNNCTGTPGFGAASSGASGGGIVLIRAGTVSGSGNVQAKGTSGNAGAGIPLNDAGGGAGAGGSVLVFVDNSGASTGAAIDVSGGAGGSNNPGNAANCPHGPGGGGSGGYAALSGSGTTVTVAGGAAGTTCTNAFTPPQYGSTSSVGGFDIVSLIASQIPGAGSNQACFPQLTVTKATSTPFVSAGAPATYTITVSNAAGKATATGVTVTDPLPANPNITYASTTGTTFGSGATQSPVTNPTVGATSPAWSTFSIPGGGSVALTFTANVAAAVASGVYQNPANVTYLDPTRTTANATVTPGGTYQGGGAVPGSNYIAASTTNEDVQVINPPPSFTKTFVPSAITPGATSVLTIVLSNPGTVALTSAAFTDTYPAGIVNTAAPGAVMTGAGCTGTLTAAPGGTSLALSAATIPTAGTCTIKVNVTTTANGTYTNTLPVAALTNTQNIVNTVAASATLSSTVTVVKSFTPAAIAPAGTSTMKLVIANPNSVAVSLANPGLTDNFPGLLKAVGGAVTVTGAGCAGFLPTTVLANATSIVFTAGTIPAGGSCTLAVDVTSNTTGIYNNTTSGVTTTSPAVTGPVSNTASLGVGLISIAKNFGPTTIQSGGTSTITYTLTNPTGVAQTAGAFLDTMLNMSAVGGAVGGTCTGTTPASFVAGATTFNFTGINIPAGSCTVTVPVTSSVVGTNPNAANGVTTALLPQGPGSNTDNLFVIGKPTIAKAFAPTRIAPSGTSTITFTLTNPNTVALTSANFTDALNANLSISGAQSAGGTCTGAAGNSYANGQTGSLSFTGLTLTAGTSCTVTVIVTGTVLGSYNNTTSGVAATESGAAGTVSNTANLVIASAPTIAKAFGTSPISQGGTSLVTFTIANANSIALTGLNFTDALTGMFVNSTTFDATSTCVGMTNSPVLAVGATSLNVTIPTLAASSSCTVVVQVKANVSGSFPNTTSGVSSAQTTTGAASNTATLVVLSPPVLAKNFVPASIEAGTNTTIVFTITNPNATALANVVFTDPLVNMNLVTGTAISDTCAATATATGLANNSTSFQVTLPSLAASESCTITVTNLTSSVTSPAGGSPNTTSTVTSTQTAVNPGAGATGFLNVYTAPTITKAFSPSTLAAINTTTTITFTLTNPNANPLTDVRFTDVLPTNMNNTAAQSFIGAGRGTCTGTIPSAKAAGNVQTENFTSTTIPANSSCTILMDVQTTATGAFTNQVTLVHSNQTPTNTTGGSDVLAVGVVSVAKSFRTAAPPGGTVLTDTTVGTVYWQWITLTNNTGGTVANNHWTDTWAATAPNVTVDNGTPPTGQNFAVTQTFTGAAACTNRTPANVTEGDTAYSLTDLDNLRTASTCTLAFPVIATAAGTKSNTVTCTNGCSGSDTATINVWAQPTIAKAFSPTTIGAGNTSTVTITLTNPAANPGALTSASFTDTLTNMSISANQSVGGTCVGTTPSSLTAGATALSFTGITIPTGGSCTVTFIVTSSTAGALPNTASGITTTQTPTAGTNSGAVNLTVVGTTLTKAFSPTTVVAGVDSQLTFTITNGAGTPAQSPLTFTDTLPANLLVSATPNATTTCTGGTVTATSGTNIIALSGASFAVGGTTCTVTVNVNSTVAATYNNVTANISGLATGMSAAGLSASLVVTAAPTLTKAFNPTTIAPGTTSVLTFTITNGAGNSAKAGLGFTDTLPANVVVAAAPGVLTNCPAGGAFAAPGGGMTVTAAAGSGSIAATATAMNNAVASCQVQVNVTSTAVGNFTNSSANISALAGGLTATGVSATLSAVGTTLTKAFSPTVIGQGGVSQMTFTITNGAGNPAQSGLSFTENLPANIFVAPVPGLVNTCGGVVTATAGAGTIPISGGVLGVGVASCSFSVNVTSAFVSSYLNDASRIVSPPATMDKSGVSATLNVLENPAVDKAFSPSTVPTATNSALTITLTNVNAVAITGVAFTDNLPVNVATVAASAATTCGGAASQTGTSVTLAGGTIPANGTCTVTVNVQGSVAGTFANTIAIGAVTSTNAGANDTAASANLIVVARPTVTKAFSPTQIGLGGTSTLTITLANSNAATALTGAAFTDTFPVNLTTVAATAATTCGGAASQTSSTVALAGGTIPAAGSCTITVNVTSNTAATYTNTIAAGGVTSTNGGSNTAPATSNLDVLLAPTTVKTFTPSSINPNATSVLSIAITNPNAAALTGVAFTDSYGATAIVNTASASGAATNCGAGTVTAANNGTSVALAGATIAAGATCTVTVNVTSSAPGVYLNSTGAIATTNAGNGVAATANLTVVSGIGATKAFSPSSIQSGGSSVLTITLTNPNTTTTVTGIAFTDTYPAGITNAAAPAGATTCTSGAVTAASGGASVALSGAQIAPGASCTVTVNVTSSTPSPSGGYTNNLGSVTATNGPTTAGGTGNLVVFAAPTIAKAFGAPSIAAGGTTTLTFTVTNPAANSATVSGITVRDVFPVAPGAMTLTNTTVTNTCAGSTVTNQAGAALAAGSTGIRVTNISVAAGASCTIAFNVTVAAAGSYSNTSDAITATTPFALTGNTASATLGGITAPTFTKVFSPTTIGPGGTSTLTFSITNPAANAAPLTGVAFSDTLPTAPGAMLVAAIPAASTASCGAPTFAPAGGATSLSFTGGTIAAGATCTVSVNVTASAGGVYNNTSGTVSTTGPAAVTGTTASSSLTVVQSSLNKAFAPTTVIAGAASTLTFTITNGAGNPAQAGMGFTDTLTAGLVVAATPNVQTNCPAGGAFGALPGGMTVTATAGTGVITVAGAPMTSGVASCAVRVDVTSNTGGSYTNATANISALANLTGAITTTTLTVNAPPTVAKAFSPVSIGTTNTSVLTITLTNGNSTAMTGVAFTDTYPGGLVNTASASGATTCGAGAVTAANGGNSVALSAGTVPANGSCTITVNVTSASAGSYLNSTGPVTTTNAGTGTAATATLTVLAHPTVTKAFSPSLAAPNSAAVLTITLTNPNTTAITGAAFTDNYPAGIANTTTPAGATTCAGGTVTATSGGASVVLAGGTIPASGSCTVTVNVTGAAPGSYTNTFAVNALSTTNAGGNNASASDTLVVASALTATKAFAPVSVGANDASVLTITLTNPNSSAVTGAAFTDSYPASLVNTASPSGATTCGAGTVTAASGGASLVLANGTVPANGSCNITVNVTSATAGSYLNNTGAISTTNAGTAASASGTLTVRTHPTITKAFAPNPIGIAGTSTLTITLANTNAVALTSAAFSDTYPAGLTNSGAPAGTTTCGAGTVTAAANGTSVALSAGTIPASGSCTVTVQVTSAAAGAYANSIAIGALTTANAGANTVAASSTLNVLSALTITKAFAAASVGTNDVSVMTITLTNPNAAPVTGAAFTDTYPAGLVNTASASGATTCAPGVVTAVNGASSVALSGGTVPASGSCTVTVNVTSASAGSYLNSTGSVTTNQGTATAGSGTLTVLSHPSVAKAMSPSTVGAGLASVLTITLTNANTTALTSVAFTDSYVAGLVNTGSASGATTCGAGTVTAANNGTSVALSGGTIPASGSCTITVNVTSNSAGSYTNTLAIGSVTTGNGGSNTTAATSTLTVLSGLTVAKAFGPGAIGTNDTSVLTITLTNPNATAVTGAAFTDSYPAGLVNTASASGATTCVPGVVTAANGGASVALSGATVPANGSCVVTVNVTSASAGSYLNSTGVVTTTNAGSAVAASSTLAVSAHPTVAKAFSPNPAGVGDTSVLTITLSNSNAAAITGAAFTDSYVAGLTNTATPAGATNCGAGTVTAAASGTSVALSGGTIPAGGSCTVTVNVQASSAGAFLNTIPAGAIITTNAGSNTAPGSATYNVLSDVTVTKVFSPSSVGTNDASVMTVTITNPNASAITGAAFTDTYPAGLVNTASASGATTCGGAVTAANGGNSLALSGATVPASGSCTVTVNVTSPSAGAYLNATGTISTTNAGTAAGGSGTLNVLSHPGAAKAFSPTAVGVGIASVLTITLTNANTTAITGAAFTDSYVAGLVNTATPAGTTTCGPGVVTAANGGTSVALSGGTIPASGSCTVTVNVTSASAGSYVNSLPIGAISSTNAGSSTVAASATLTVLSGLGAAKAFSPAAIGTNDTSVLTITLTNPNSTAVTGAAFTDSYPAGLVNTASASGATTCVPAW